MMKYFFLFLLNLYFISGFCQSDTTKMVRYDFSFYFEEGIYPDFFSVKTNSPVPFERIVDPPSDDPDFFYLLDNTRTISYFDDFGSLKEVDKPRIWGYSRNGKPYIFWADKFNLIPYLGSISHFVTTVKVNYTTGGYDPFYSSYYYYNNYYPTRTYQTEELRQFLIDFETGKVLVADPKNVEVLLGRTPELQKEFSKLGKRKKNKRMFEYIRLYNEQVPLYIPKK